jgi:hypothetical protein
MVTIELPLRPVDFLPAGAKLESAIARVPNPTVEFGRKGARSMHDHETGAPSPTSRDPLDVTARLDELRALQDGWCEGTGRSPSDDGLDWYTFAFDRHFADGLPLPYLYPTPEGGVQAEWSIGGREISLEIDLEARTGVWHVLGSTANDEVERELNLTKSGDWNWIANELRCD